MPSLWAGEPDGDNQLPGMWCESHRRIARSWQGPSAERYGYATECQDDSIVPDAHAQQPTRGSARHRGRDSGCSWHFGAQLIRMALFGW